MPAHVSAAEDLVLHGPRVMGFATASRVASRFGLDPDVAEDLLLDLEARGWVQHSSFAGRSGWSVTDTGRTEDERRLAAELVAAGARETVTVVHTEFVPLNRRFTQACTRWQIRPVRGDPMAFNDHTDWTWDEQVVQTLMSVDRAFGQLCERLSGCLQRFDGYAERYASAAARVAAGEPRWVDAADLDSCHTVWIQLHEDLLATLGIPRGSDG